MINWQTHLANFIAKNKRRPFEWGEFDCCLFAADAYQIITGQDYAKDFRGRYKTKIGASRAIKAAGFDDLKGLLTSIFGEPKVGIDLSRGSLCIVETEQGQAAAIYFGGAAWTTGPSGLVALSPNDILCFWSVETCHQ